MTPEQEAKNTPEDEREDKAVEYILKCANNQKKVAKELNKVRKNADKERDNLLKQVKAEDYPQVASIIEQSKQLLRELQNDGDYSKILAKLNSLKK